MTPSRGQRGYCRRCRAAQCRRLAAAVRQRSPRARKDIGDTGTPFRHPFIQTAARFSPRPWSQPLLPSGTRPQVPGAPAERAEPVGLGTHPSAGLRSHRFGLAPRSPAPSRDARLPHIFTSGRGILV